MTLAITAAVAIYVAAAVQRTAGEYGPAPAIIGAMLALCIAAAAAT